MAVFKSGQRMVEKLNCDDFFEVVSVSVVAESKSTKISPRSSHADMPTDIAEGSSDKFRR